MISIILRIWIFAALLTGNSFVMADDIYPLKKPVTIIVPFAAGSGTDVIGRILATELQNSMGGTFLVENRPGRVGIVGTEQAGKAVPDGYTLVISSGAQHSLAKWLFKNVNYDPVDGFEHISKVLEAPFLLLINPSLPVNNLNELLAYARANPGKLAYGYGTASGQLGATLLNSIARIETLGIPYKGQALALTDLVGGQLQFMVADLAIAKPMINSGQVKALAVTTTTRLASVPSVPTMIEAGLPGYSYSSWVGLAAPRGTPRQIVEQLNTELRKLLDKPEVRTKIEVLGMSPRSNTSAEQKLFVQAELERLGKIVKDANIQPE